MNSDEIISSFVRALLDFHSEEKKNIYGELNRFRTYQLDTENEVARLGRAATLIQNQLDEHILLGGIIDE